MDNGLNDTDSTDVASAKSNLELKKSRKVVENGVGKDKEAIQTDGDVEMDNAPKANGKPKDCVNDSHNDCSDKEGEIDKTLGEEDSKAMINLLDQKDSKSSNEDSNTVSDQEDVKDVKLDQNNSKAKDSASPIIEKVKLMNGEKEGKGKLCVKKEFEDDNNMVDKGDEKNDSEKENNNSENMSRTQPSTEGGASVSSLEKDLDSPNDDIEIIGESKVINLSPPSNPHSSSQMGSKNSNLLAIGHRFSSPSSTFGGSHVSGIHSSPYSHSFSNMNSGFMISGIGSTSSPNMSMLPQPVAPPKPKSSLDQIELIRWEIQNRINTRPKYFKPNPTAELGPLSKFLFDIGSDLIKESVYHELVKIQSKKQDDDKLSDKEKDDLGKLKDIERDLNKTVGHLKLRMRKRCRTCHFQTESTNVLYYHKQFPHEDGKNHLCAHCSFVSKVPMSFKFHIESEHNIQPRLLEKKFFYECDLCQYENNKEHKLNIHKQRCAKQYRPLFNLHPSCLSGAEINLCLENIFYKPIVPKNLKVLQHKHLQQQAALAEARRQQAEVAAIAAQRNSHVIGKRPRQPLPPAPRINPARINPGRITSPMNNRPQFQPRLPAPPMSQVRFNSRSPVTAVRPTVANMLKDKQASSKGGALYPSHHGSAPVGFEVCEICGGYVKDRKALRIHFFYAHRIDLPLNLFDRNQPPLYCATCSVRFWTANGLRKHLDVHAQEKRIPDGFIGEGVSGKCIACGQLVGNIVVHMRVVHNREIHHYINALMCMFCGASFNSHANVERHVKDVHGTIDIATGAVKVKGKLKSSPSPMPKITAPPKKSNNSSNNSLVKGSVCVLCNLNFGRNVDLTRHCMRTHHTCMKCGMVVIDKDSLLKHTCLTSPSGTRDCTMCPEAGFHPAYYVKHLRDKHLKKFSIDVARVSAPIIEKWTKRTYPFKQRKEDLVEISDSDEESPVTCFKVETPSPALPPGPPKKKVRIGPASKINRPLLSNGVDDASESCDNTDNGKANGNADNLNSANDSTEESTEGSKRKQSFDSTESPERSSKRKK